MNSFEIAFVVAFVLVSLVFAMFTETVAEAKGYGARNWFWGGFCFTLIALIAAAGLPVKMAKSE